MDYLDLMQGRYYQTRTGKYFERLPEARLFIESSSDIDAAAVGVPFDYEVVDPFEYQYKHLLQNVIDNDGAIGTIKTREQLNFKNRSYIVTMEGEMFQIVSITPDTRAAQREAARILPIPLGTEYIIRFVEVDNPRGLA